MYSPKRTFQLADHILGFTKDSAFNFQLISSVGIFFPFFLSCAEFISKVKANVQDRIQKDRLFSRTALMWI